MSKQQNNGDGKNGHLFTVDILIEADNNAHAVEKLARILNHGDVLDFRVNQGITLGAIIESALQHHRKKNAVSKEEQAKTGPKGGASRKDSKQSAKPAEGTKSDYRPIVEQIEQYMEHRTLVRLTIVKGKGVKLSVPCRIVNYDWSTELITVYHVDEKKVYSYRFNEIDDLTSG